ncbi:hypothetical protein ACFCT7_00055 [Fulvivirgaceae bacterium LMO-SS25]
MKTEYRPIDCNFYDNFEAFATQGKLCSIYYMNEQNQMQFIEDYIKTITIEDKVEYLMLNSNLRIRLDKIFRINGLESPSFVGNTNPSTCS